MLEKTTLFQMLTFLFSPAGIGIVLDRIPLWKNWTSATKGYIIMALGVIAGFLLPAVLAQVPADLSAMPLDKIIIAVFATAAAFIIHLLDEWLALSVKSLKIRLNVK